MKNFQLNFNVYPLVVGQIDKFTFSGWETEGGTIQLRPSILPEGFSAEDIVWTSADEKIAVVSESGLVRAMTTGITDIRATLPDGSCDTCRVQNIDNWGRLTCDKVTLNTPKLVLNLMDGAMLYPQIFPADYFENGLLDKTFIWTSSDTDVAVVNHQGRIWAKACGNATITGVSMDIGRVVTCEVEVIKKSKAEQYIDPLEDLSGGSLCLTENTCKLELPKVVAHQEVWWCCSNESIATVEQNGTVSFHKDGKVTVFATFIRGGHRVIYDVSYESKKADVLDRITKVVLNKEKINLVAGAETEIYAAVFPADLLEAGLEWKVEDQSVARITKQHINLSGLDEILVEGLREGHTAIAGKIGNFTVTCQLRVFAEKTLPEAITLPEIITLDCQEITDLQPVFTGDATDVEVVWSSEDEKIVTVDREGVVKGYEPGETVITCSLKSDSKIHAKTLVKVVEESKALSNLHIPEETITDNSVCLLWNRKSLLDTDDFGYYSVYVNGEKAADTEKLGYRVEDLEPETAYTFAVEAKSKTDKTIYRQNVTASTKKTPVTVLDVTKAPYNAVGDGLAMDTKRIQAAIDDCPKDGVVLLPKGYVFHSGALFLKDDMTFKVDGILYGSYDPKDYPPVVCRWEGYRKMRLTEENQEKTVPVFDENVYSHSSLINVGVYDEGEAGKLSPIHSQNIRICGEGMINGNGFMLSYNQGPVWYTYMRGLPVPQSPMLDQNIRGRVIAFYNAKNVYVSDVTVCYGPAWTIHPVFSRDVTFDRVKVITMGNGRTGVKEGMLILNGDGIDPDSSTHVNIFDSYFTVGDDAVSIKSGRNRQGYELAKPSAYIRVTDCVCIDAKCSFCIGSEPAGGVHDILFQNLRVENLKNFALWIKSAPCRGGLIEHVLWRDCDLKNIGGAPIQIEYRHGGNENPSIVLPETRDVTYENITIDGKSRFGIRLIGHPESPIHDVTFRGLTFHNFGNKRDNPFHIEDCRDIWFIDADLPEGYEWYTP